MIELAFRARLASLPAVAALVGARVYPVTAPQNPTLPYIVYGQAGGTFDATLDGILGKREIILRVFCWAQTWDEAHALAKVVRGTNTARGLHAWGGRVMVGDEEIRVTGCFLVAENDDRDDELKYFCVTQQYRVTGKE
jgi:hypothetical protein